jgi:hypothetical protein
MARPQVADRGNALKVWRVAENILNKQSWTADKGWPSSLGVEPLTIKNKLVTKPNMKPWNWMDSLDKRPKLKKMDMRFGTWNVRSM